MDKQQQNIQRVVAAKALKDINKIVEDDRVKEKQEKNVAMLVAGVILFLVILIFSMFYL